MSKAEDGAARCCARRATSARGCARRPRSRRPRRRADAVADAEAELAMAKQQGREMVEEARAYRERVLGELARRRELARQQIEQLMHGRDRLLQAFERARLVAVDVVAELTPLGEPDEYVNLTPTTGPVPMMVPTPDASTRPSCDHDRRDAWRSTRRSRSARCETEPTCSSDDDAIAESDARADAEPTSPTPSRRRRRRRTPRPSWTPTASRLRWRGARWRAVRADVEAEAASEPDTSPTATAHDGVPPPTASTRRRATTRHDDVVDALFARPRRRATVADVRRAGRRRGRRAGRRRSRASPTSRGTTPFARRDAALTPLIVAAGRKLKRVLADEQNEVLDALRRKEPVRDIDALVAAEGEQSPRYADAITVELIAAVEAGAASVGGATRERRPRPDGRSPSARRRTLRRRLVDPLRERLDRGVADGERRQRRDRQAASARVYREWKTQRIDEQLDDLFRLAYGHGVVRRPRPGRAGALGRRPERAAVRRLRGQRPGRRRRRRRRRSRPGTCRRRSHPGCRCLLVPADR